jgi:plasmid stabilization system protein ParE
MTRIVVSPEAAEALDRLILTHHLPADAKERVKRSVASLKQFPSMGRALERQLAGRRFLLGPWRWMIIVYRHDEETDEVHVLTVEDAHTSNATTNLRV